MAEDSGSTPQVNDQAPSFSLLLEQFSQTMEAVLEVLETVSPHVASLDDLSQHSFVLPPPPESGQKILEEALDKQLAKNENDPGAPASDDEPRVISQEDSEDFAKAFVAAYKEDPETLKLLVRSIRSMTTRPRREHLLHGSLLAMAVGTLETAIAGVGTQHFVLHPGALPSTEKEFSLSELSEFDDLRDARDLAISRRVEDLMRGGFEAWDKWFDQLLGEGFADLAADHEMLHEAIQRRHLVVHNAGRVSRQYKSKVASCEKSVGEDLPISRGYLEDAIDAVTIFGARLILVAWSKWLPEDKNEAAREANELVFSYLMSGRPEPALCIATTAGEFAEENQTKLYLQVNGWQARKRLSGLEDVREDIEAWDTTALSPEYAAAKFALLEEYDPLFQILPGLLEQEILNAEKLRAWPLFEGARQQDRWTQIEKLLPPDEKPEEPTSAEEAKSTESSTDFAPGPEEIHPSKDDNQSQSAQA